MDTSRALAALSTYAQLYDWEEGEAPSVFLDDDSVSVAATSRGGAFYRVPIARIRGEHTLRVQGPDDGPVFFVVDGRWAVPLSEDDTVARGRRTAVHRRFETAAGRPIADGEEVALGELVRVRLFVYTESSAPELVSLHDPIVAGFDAVDAGNDTTPTNSLHTLLGTSPQDGAVDARAHIAMRSVNAISHRALETNAVDYFFERLPLRLQEFTYAIRASAVGEFTVPPAQIDALYDTEFVARSAVNHLRVVERRSPEPEPEAPPPDEAREDAIEARPDDEEEPAEEPAEP